MNTIYKFKLCGAVWDDLGHLATPQIAGKSILSTSMAPTLGWPPFLSSWESHVPASVKYVAVIIVALVASTLIFSMMLPTGGCRASYSITQAEMRNIDQLCREANAMAKHDEFLRKAVPYLSRVGNHSLTCRSAHGENCTCNVGAYTFSNIADLEAQLLKPSSTQGVNSIRNARRPLASKTSNVSATPPMLRRRSTPPSPWVQRLQSSLKEPATCFGKRPEDSHAL